MGGGEGEEAMEGGQGRGGAEGGGGGEEGEEGGGEGGQEVAEAAQVVQEGRGDYTLMIRRMVSIIVHFHNYVYIHSAFRGLCKVHVQKQ